MSSEGTIYSVDTELPADSVEFCPHLEYRNILVCGTYNLVKNGEGASDAGSAGHKPQERNGRCLVYEYDETSQILKEIERIEAAAILDLKWSYGKASPNPMLALAESVGRIQFREWRGQERTLSTIQSIQVAEPHVLCLSIDWSNRLSAHEAGNLVVSKSDGALSLLKANESQFDIEMNWHAHDFEPWVAAWNYWTPTLVYSGGDDCKLKGWDTRTSCTSPTFTNKRFEAGVTSIQTHPFVENIVAVGSYNNTVKLFDSRNMASPLTEIGVGGGAWRVKWHPSISNTGELLVACMHDGFKVVSCSFEGGESGAGITDVPAVSSRFDAHTSLAYGADWQHGGHDSKFIVASCSFYDHMLCLWSPQKML